MFSLIKQLILLLTPSQRKRLFTLQALVVLMAVMEVVSVSAIGPFIAVIGDSQILNQENILGNLYKLSGADNFNEFIFFSGIAVLFLLFIAAFISIITVWRLSLFSTKVGAEIGDRLYKHYMFQNWLFHSSGSSAQLTKQIATETHRMTGQILNPLMQMNAKIVLAVFMLIALFIFNPMVTLVAICIFTTAYFILYKFVRKRLAENGRKISLINTQRYKLMAEGFGGIKDLLLLGRQSNLVEKFAQSGVELSYSQGVNQALAQAPKYFMELVAYSSVIFLVLYLIKTYDGDLGLILPVLAVYALAGFKLLPAFQGIYLSLAAIKGGMAAFESVQNDLKNSIDVNKPQVDHDTEITPLLINDSIKLNNVNFCYPGKNIPAVKECTIEIPINKTIGIVGASGSGKSTIIDLLLGLIVPSSGELLIDGKPLHTKNIRQWQDKLGFVPQSIFLSEASILENIAFGLPKEIVDVERVNEVIKLAHLSELVQSLPDGLDTKVGERGVQLSGGQRQRIGIARSLYHKAEVLIFDEATSALDGITEKLIMDAINDFAGKKTILMVAHRLKTIEKCDIIYLMEDGSVIDSGTFEELKSRNVTFSNMVEHA